MTRYTYLHGKYRLLFGFCPECNSSPPRDGCPVCDGTSQYGSMISDHTRQVWGYRWRRIRDEQRGDGRAA